MSAAEQPIENDIAAEARALIRAGLKASLATLTKGSGYPYASLITVATSPEGAPLFLISKLAYHTQYLLEDPRASILFDGTDGLGDPLEGGRVSVYGTARVTQEASARARFLARHPSASMYVDFADFDFYQLDIEGAHFVGGFGRIHDLTPKELLIDISGAGALLEAEGEIVAHMNEDHSDAVALYATNLLGAVRAEWRFSGCDPEGCDLVSADRALRLPFPKRVTGPGDIRKTLAELATQARSTAKS